MINGVHHISLATTDMDRLLRFYRDLIGLEQCFEFRFDAGDAAFEKVVGMVGTRGRAAGLRAGKVYIEVFAYANPVPRPVEKRPACDAGIRHICFDVTDIHAEYARLAEAGLEFLSAPQSLAPGISAVYARDPDGNIVELQEISPGCSWSPN